MATYATYRHVELDRVGVGKKRVLKPPGGGSSIVFDEDESMKPVKSRPQQQEQQTPPPQASPEPPKEAPPAEKQPEQPFPKPESNGMSTPDCIKEDAASTRDSNPSPAATTNGQRSPALNGPPAVNGASTTNGSLSSGSSSMSMQSGGTPKHINTQTRIFGDEQGAPTPRRRLRDHERSNIFASDEASSNSNHRPVFRRPRTRRDPVTGVGVLCWDLHAPRFAPSKWKADVNGSSRNSDSTPETRTPDPAQQAPRQRIPPGGFSTKLW